MTSFNIAADDEEDEDAMTDTAPAAGESNDAQYVRKHIAARMVRITECDAVPLPDGDPVRIAIMNPLADARAKLNDVDPKAYLNRTTRILARRKRR